MQSRATTALLRLWLSWRVCALGYQRQQPKCIMTPTTVCSIALNHGTAFSSHTGVLRQHRWKVPAKGAAQVQQSGCCSARHSYKHFGASPKEWKWCVRLVRWHCVCWQSSMWMMVRLPSTISLGQERKVSGFLSSGPKTLRSLGRGFYLCREGP